jgi:hypothetical protein
MKFCGKHLNQVEQAIRDHGLWSRVSKSGSELVARHARCDPYDVDPLELLALMVTARARHVLAVNQVKQEEGACPACILEGDHLTIAQAAQSVATRIATLDREKLLDIERSRELERLQR